MPLLEQFPWLHSRWIGYVFAVLSVAAVAVSLSYAAYVLRSPYLIPFMMAVACSALFGLGPGLAALLLATVITVCFFVPRLDIVTLNPGTWIAIGSYGLALLLTRLAERYLRRRAAQSFLFRTLAGKQDEEGATQQALLGRLDGDAEGELYGWALDKSCLSIPPKITFYVHEQNSRGGVRRPLPPGCGTTQFLLRPE